MPADKKADRLHHPRPEKENTKHPYQEDQDQKIKNDKQKIKQKRVNYIIKDLPIY